MKKSKLIETLSSFSTSELIKLQSFLEHPPSCSKPPSLDEKRLLAYLIPYCPHFKSEHLNKQKVFQALYPEGKWVKGKLEKRMTALLSWVERFICWEQWEKSAHSVERELLLAKFYEERGAERLHELSIRRLQKSIEGKQVQDKSYYLRSFLVQRRIAEYQSLTNTRKSNLAFPKAQESLEIFYIVHQLSYYCAFLSIKGYEITPQVQADLDGLIELGKHLETKPHLNIPLIRAYGLALIFLLNRNAEAEFRAFRALLVEHDAAFNLQDRQTLRAFCRNFSIYHSNQGNLHYEAETFNIYQKDLEEGLLYYNNGLTVSTLRNIVTSGLRQKQYDWVKQLIDDHRDRIIGVDKPEEIYQFNLANYHFAIGEYDAALDLITDHYDDLYYQIAARRLEIRIHYEMDSPLLDAKLDAFKTFLYRLSKKQISEQQRRGNQHFFNALRQILHPQTPFDEQRIARLTEKWQNQLVLVDKYWLLEKLGELKP